MAKTLEEVRVQFPNAKYPAREGCKYCDGSGEKKSHPGFPCICVYVSHDMADFAAMSLSDTAKKLSKELRQGW